MRAIDADELVKTLSEQAVHILNQAFSDYSTAEARGIVMAIDSVKKASTVDLVKHGKWLHNSDRPDKLICSVCDVGFDMWYYETKDLLYCPCCGAKMDGGKE